MGGNKAGKYRFYEEMISRADQFFDAHLKELANAKKQKRPPRRV
jgi:hypothetical protein